MGKQILNISTSFAKLQHTPGEQTAVSNDDSEMLFGEEFEVTDFYDGWAKGVSVLDGYEGWVRRDQLTAQRIKTTHAVNLRSIHAHVEPGFKSCPSLTLTFMSRVAVDTSLPAVKGFVALKAERPLWVAEEHLISLDSLATNPADIVDTAMMFGGTYYGYGGRTAWGVDCSGVVQLALQRNNVFCPRDTHQQMPVLGEQISLENIQRGDIVYFPGHVGIMVDSANILNATVRHMSTVVEPLSVLREKYRDNGSEAILGIRRVKTSALSAA